MESQEDKHENSDEITSRIVYARNNEKVYYSEHF